MSLFWLVAFVVIHKGRRRFRLLSGKSLLSAFRDPERVRTSMRPFPAEEVRMPDAVSDPKGPTSDPKDVLRRFFATLGTGDFAAIGEFFTDDSVWMVNDVARGFPSERGRRAIIEDFLQPVREGLFEPGDPKIEVRSMIGEGDRVAAETTARGMLRNGNHYENYYVFIAQVDGDKVKFLREYMDTAYAHDISEGSAPDSDDADEHVAAQLRRLGH
jgi:ketosteroid isomerase-like protein